MLRGAREGGLWSRGRQESRGGGHSAYVSVSPGPGERPGAACGQCQARGRGRCPGAGHTPQQQRSLTILLACPSLSAPAPDLDLPANKSRKPLGLPPPTSHPVQALLGSSPEALAIPDSSRHPVLGEAEEGRPGAVRAWGLRIPESRACSAGLGRAHAASPQSCWPRVLEGAPGRAP